jgi:hypothetical protein
MGSWNGKHRGFVPRRVGSVVRLGLALLIVLAVRVPVARADEVIDQSNINFTPSLFQSIQVFSPIGQSFTPTLTSLDFFDVFTQDFVRNNGIGATLEIEIFSGVLQTLLGTSRSTTLPDDYNAPTHFTFSTPIALVPGNLYSAQVIVLSGDNWALGSSGSQSYSGGDEILLGVPVTDNDLWFREGITVTAPESSTLLLLGSGFVGFAWKRLRQS